MRKGINLYHLVSFLLLSQLLNGQVDSLDQFNRSNIHLITPEQIFEAIEQDYDVLKLMAENHVSIDVVDGNGESPLSKVCAADRAHLVEMLLDLTELPITQKTASGKDLAEWALTGSSLQTCQVLLDRGYPKVELEKHLWNHMYRFPIGYATNFLYENDMTILPVLPQILVEYLNYIELPHSGFLPIGWDSDGKLAFFTLNSSEVNFSVIDTVTDEILYAIPEGTEDFTRGDTRNQEIFDAERFQLIIDFIMEHEGEIQNILSQFEIHPINDEYPRDLTNPFIDGDREFHIYYQPDPLSAGEGGIYVYNPESGTKRITGASSHDRPVGGIKNPLGPNLAVIVESDKGFYISGCLMNRGFKKDSWEVKKGKLLEMVQSKKRSAFIHLGRTPDNEAVYIGHNGEAYFLCKNGIPIGAANNTSPLNLFYDNQGELQRLFEEEDIAIVPHDNLKKGENPKDYYIWESPGDMPTYTIVVQIGEDYYEAATFDFESPASSVSNILAISFDYSPSIYFSIKIDATPEQENVIWNSGIGVIKEGYLYWSAKKDELFRIDYPLFEESNPYDDDYDYVGTDPDGA